MRCIQCPKDNLCIPSEIQMIQNSGTMPDKSCAEQVGKVRGEVVHVHTEVISGRAIAARSLPVFPL